MGDNMDLNTVLNALTMLADDIHIGDNVCSDTNVLKALRFVGYIVTIARYFVPLLIIGFGTLDLYKAVMGGSSDSFTKQIKGLGMRLVIGIFIVFVPTLLHLVLSQIDSFGTLEGEYHNCEICVLEPFDCNP